MLVRRVTVLSSLLLALAVAMPVAATTAPAQATTGPAYAPLDRPGPKLAVDPAKLRASLACRGNPSTGGEPVLLSPGTTATPEQNFSWNYEPAFTAQHRYWCALTMPAHTTGDIQTAAEYLVHGIRTMYQRAGRRIAVYGHSQGGMSMRWALRFWPDTRSKVRDIIGAAGTNHGSTAFGQQCLTGLTTCPPAMWQQRAGSRFIKALNSGTETFRGIEYTEIYTHTDEVVTPNSGPAASTSSLHTGQGEISDVATQDICPLVLNEHVTVGTSDPVTYALVMDALNHRGPAVPARIDRAVCGRLTMPYVDPTDAQLWITVLQMLPGLGSAELPFVNTYGSPSLKAEPKLRCYVFAAGC